MKKLGAVLMAILVVVLASGVVGCGGGGEVSPTPTGGATPTPTLPAITLRLAHDHPVDDILGIIVQEFADRVSEASGGQLKIEIFPMGTLFSGFGLWTAAVRGTADITCGYDYIPAIADPGFYICGSPGLFNEWEEGYEFVNHPDGGQRLLSMMEEHGVKGLAMFPAALTLVTMSRDREIKSWHDMNGLRQMGYGGDVSETYTEITGMQVVYMSASDVYSALQQGLIDVAQSSPDVVLRTHREEVCKYGYVWTGLSVQNVGIWMNLGVWNNLPAAYQDLIEQVIENMKPWAFQSAKDVDQTSLAKLAESVTLHYESAEDRAEMMGLWLPKLEARGYWNQFDPVVLATARQIGGGD